MKMSRGGNCRVLAHRTAGVTCSSVGVAKKDAHAAPHELIAVPLPAEVGLPIHDMAG